MAYQQGYSTAPPPYNPGYQAVPGGGYKPQYQPYNYNPPPPLQQTNVVVVGTQPTYVQQQRVIVRDEGPNHLLHLLITILFWPWAFVWLLLCIMHGC